MSYRWAQTMLNEQIALREAFKPKENRARSNDTRRSGETQQEKAGASVQSRSREPSIDRE